MKGGVRRSSFSRKRRRELGWCATSFGLQPSALPLQESYRRGGAVEEPHQVDGGLEGGARVCGDEAQVRICEAALSRTEEKCHPTVRGVRAGEPVSTAEKIVASDTGLSPGAKAADHERAAESGGGAKKLNPNAGTGIAEHLLPRRTALFRVSLERERLFFRCNENRRASRRNANGVRPGLLCSLRGGASL